MEQVKKLTDEVSTWPQISVQSHRYGGWEFRLGSAEVGHVHAGGVVDIPFPMAVRNFLLEKGLASEHHWVPDSGWVTFGIRNEQDLKHALWLMRLSYIRYAVKTAADPLKFLEQESQALQLGPGLTSLVEKLVARRTSYSRTEQLTQ